MGMWHDKNTQLKIASLLHSFKKLFYSQHSQGILDLHGGTIPVAPCKNWDKTISVHWIRKRFLSFKLFTTASQEKSCLPNWFTIFHMVSEETLSPTAFATWWTFINNCETPDLFFWLIFLVSFQPSLTTMRFSHSSSINTNLGESCKFPMSFISIPSIVLSQL